MSKSVTLSMGGNEPVYYFQLQQDSLYQQPLSLEKVGRNTEFQERNQFFVDENKGEPFYLDYMEEPRWFVSHAMKEWLEKCDPSLSFQVAVLTERSTQQQRTYWLMEPAHVECLSEKADVDMNGNCKRLILNKRKLKSERIFRVAGLRENVLIIRLDISESLFRRAFTGFQCIPVEFDETME